MTDALFKAIIMLPPLLVAVILHEIAHGWVAEKCGDPTARQLGRITLNPIKHIDPVMTIILPAILLISGSPVIFGGAKPVPINPGALNNPRRDMILVAAAGPSINFILALCCYLIIKSPVGAVVATLPLGADTLLLLWLVHSILINIVLGVFNLIPVPPLDGGRIAVGVLPLDLARPLARLEPYGILIVFFLLYIGVLDSVLGPVVSFALRQMAGI